MESTLVLLLGPFLVGYLLGSIPFGLLLTRAAGLGDIRKVGSGNIGATNVLRTGRRGLAAATLLLDALKGVAAVLIFVHVSQIAAVGAAAGAVLGHMFPVWLRFKGGKGVATMLGILVPIFWQAAVVFAVIWVGLFLVARISSLAGMIAAASAPVTAAVLGEQALFPMLLGFALLVVWKHRENIRRLAKGEEPRAGKTG
jgi:acyl phosphate:glycerol-3-phosphate acyltransferase